jgi:hypothetical protein
VFLQQVHGRGCHRSGRGFRPHLSLLDRPPGLGLRKSKELPLDAIWHNAKWRKAGLKLMPRFERYVGVDYSGAATAESSLKEIRVYLATATTEPAEEFTPPAFA